MMKKRLLALVLCLATAIALIPALPAEAAVLPGMTSKVDLITPTRTAIPLRSTS